MSIVLAAYVLLMGYIDTWKKRTGSFHIWKMQCSHIYWSVVPSYSRKKEKDF